MYASRLCCSRAICANDGSGGGEGTRGGLSSARPSIFDDARVDFVPIDLLLLMGVGPFKLIANPTPEALFAETCALISSADTKLPEVTATTLLVGVATRCCRRPSET